MRGLGRIFDVGVGIVPVNLATAANTGKRVHMRNYETLAVVGFLNTGTAAEAVTFDIQEHDAATAGNSQDLDVVTQYYTKTEATLDGDEQWVEVTQAAASEITNADWDDANQLLMVAEIEAASMSDGFEWLSCDVPDTGTSHIGAVLYIMHGLKIMRNPDLLAQPNA